uniref:Uncharacterized protein n=1 Tax=Vespula pensylvanica TaxID=30213 RepID=A0A834NKA3_VESPE|nr:hypothetical protein H0235_013536 [Vespula pensylvanica]
MNELTNTESEERIKGNKSRERKSVHSLKGEDPSLNTWKTRPPRENIAHGQQYKQQYQPDPDYRRGETASTFSIKTLIVRYSMQRLKEEEEEEEEEEEDVEEEDIEEDIEEEIEEKVEEEE